MSTGSAAPSDVLVSEELGVLGAALCWGMLAGVLEGSSPPGACCPLPALLPMPHPLTCAVPDPLAEPHEICDEDNFGAVVWKETPAGEVAAVRCPRNATGLILRRCELDEEGIAYWEPPTYIRCISIDYRNIQMMTREHLAKAQRGLPGEGVSEVIQTLVEISQDGTSYSGDLLSTIDVLRNMTEIFRRAYYSPTPGDVQNFVQIISNLLAEENRDKWEEAQLMGSNAKELFRLVEDFVDVIGFRMKDLRDAYQVTDNLASTSSRPAEPQTSASP
ncbi:hypothetical protein MC885_006330 [Smutsia gigantea]|nr:hypothetical protein MC885_006330 [Smutsia gigantea]